VTRTLLVVLVALAVSLPALAQDTTAAPTFTYADKPKEDAKDTGWKAEAKAGLLWLAGNSDSTSLSAGLKVTKDAVWQRYSLTAAYAFAKSRTYESPSTPTVIDNLDQLRSASLLSARLWNVTPRFDQWLIHRNEPGDTSVYVLANLASDYAAGKKLFGGAQVGVSTLILKTGGHSLTGELGYDFTYLQPSDPKPNVSAEGYSIHSIRVALAYVWDITKSTKFTAGAEYLINVNQETGAPDPVNINFVSAFQDHRVNGLVSLTTQVYDRLSLNVSWTGRYDAKPNLATLPANVTSANPPGIFLRTFDSITQVQFVYTMG
jgi:putative salt-induced outer membrane protein YdiY